MRAYLEDMQKAIAKNDAKAAARAAFRLGQVRTEFLHLRSPAARKIRAMLKNLSGGRAEGVKARQATAEERRKTITTAIEQLFKSGPGDRMTNDGIRDFLIDRGISTYTKASTLRIVNEVAARFRNIR